MGHRLCLSDAMNYVLLLANTLWTCTGIWNSVPNSSSYSSSPEVRGIYKERRTYSKNSKAALLFCRVVLCLKNFCCRRWCLRRKEPRLTFRSLRCITEEMHRRWSLKFVIPQTVNIAVWLQVGVFSFSKEWSSNS